MSEAAEESAVKKRSSGRKVALVIASVALIFGAVVFGRWLVWRVTHVTTNAAYVKADMANVAPQVAGKVVEVVVKEGQSVNAGDLLLRIEDDQYRRKLGEALAALEQARAAKGRAESAVRLAERQVPAAVSAARAAVKAAKSQLAKAKANRVRWERQYLRFKRLLEQQAIAKSKFEQVETAWKAAVADEKAAKAQVDLARAKLEEAEAAQAKISEARAALAEAEKAVSRAEEAVKLARLAVSWCSLKAPIKGLVARVLVEPGDFVAPGRPVVGIYDPTTRYVEARFEETKLRYIQVGDEARLKIDAIPGKWFEGVVTLTAPASASEFALIPRDITAGEFVKVTQRVPIKIKIKEIEEHPEIVPGLSVEVAIARR